MKTAKEMFLEVQPNKTNWTQEFPPGIREVVGLPEFAQMAQYITLAAAMGCSNAGIASTSFEMGYKYAQLEAHELKVHAEVTELNELFEKKIGVTANILKKREIINYGK